MMRPLVRDGGVRQREYVSRRAKPGMSVAERLSMHTAVATSGCWIWLLSPDDMGYGRITVDGAAGLYVHRLSYELHVGPIPEGFQLDHLCRNRRCCNPEHLEPVTSRVNTLRGVGFAAQNAVKTHCPRGHEYDEVNTYLYNGRRYCRECKKARRVSSQQERKAGAA